MAHPKTLQVFLMDGAPTGRERVAGHIDGAEVLIGAGPRWRPDSWLAAA